MQTYKYTWWKIMQPWKVIGFPLFLCTGRQYGDAQKTKSRTDIQPSNPIPGLVPKENRNSKRYMFPNVQSRPVYNSKDLEAIQLPINK